MEKSIIFFLLIIFLVHAMGCNNSAPGEQEIRSQKFIFKIYEPSVEHTKTIKLHRRYGVQFMRIVENTLNDTALIGIHKIPPNKKGRLYRSEFFGDSMSYKYFPYLATQGKLVIEHIFSDY